MPFRLRKAPRRPLFWVVDDTGKHYSKDPMPKERARQQQKALYASEGRGELRGGADEEEMPIPMGLAARGRMEEQDLNDLRATLEMMMNNVDATRQIVVGQPPVSMEQFEELKRFYDDGVRHALTLYGQLDSFVRDAERENQDKPEALARIRIAKRESERLGRMFQTLAPLSMPPHLQPPREAQGGARCPRFGGSRYF